MPTATTHPHPPGPAQVSGRKKGHRSAAELLARLGPFGPAVEGAELVFASAPPPQLHPVLSVLHTGVRALLAGRRWWGSSSETPRVVELNPAAPIPTDVTLLCVEGDPCWDRIDPDARTSNPELFAA